MGSKAPNAPVLKIYPKSGFLPGQMKFLLTWMG